MKDNMSVEKFTDTEKCLIYGINYYGLYYFMTGPLISKLDLKSWGSSTAVVESLVNDLDCVSRKVLYPELLVFSYAVFSNNQINIFTRFWWQIRMLSTLQSLLNELSNDLKNMIELVFEQMEKTVWETDEEEALFRIEQCKIYLSHYGNITKATNCLNTAMDLLGLEHSLVGAMGKRTKFQVKELAQLTLTVNSHTSENNTNLLTSHECCDLPKDCVLDDENRLPDIKFSNESAGKFPKLSSLQQAAILNTLILEQKCKPKDDLQFEELQPYIRCLLSQQSVWSVHVSTLLQRSLLERDSRKSVERAMRQIESLVSSLEVSSPLNVERLYLFHCSFVSPSWQLKAYLGNIMLSIGAIQSALDWFLALDLWEECVACYNTQGHRHKAAQILENELKSSNLTVAKHILILCLLGDATDDKSRYEEAWKISDYRSSRAQKHWALYYYSRKEYKESIDHFKNSLKINSLQENLWFRLGFACMIEERWSEAAEAYRRYCDIESECFEAWNNLAKCYIKNGQKSRAYYALKEAVKCNYESWMVWDNLMVVSVDCGCFEEVCIIIIITSLNNALISIYGGGFRCKSEYPWYYIDKKLTFSNSFQKNREKQKKNDGKTAIFTQNQFSTKSIFFLWFSNFCEICRKRENLQTTEIFNFSEKHLKFKFRQKFVKIINICKLFCSSKFKKLFVFISNVKKFNTKFSISFASKSYRENFKRHYRKNVLSTDKSSPTFVWCNNNLCGVFMFQLCSNDKKLSLDDLEEIDNLYGLTDKRFNYNNAPKRGWQEDKKDFSHKKSYIKYHESGEEQPYSVPR
ncbi:hypothetical protein AGLY_007047 [Aphis glycines]|uniref:Uncharacterized protein n=1 Tax=Aphis glycines TaxID=307491 RepID=A0A6G0TRT1_APHGL|nr:hypothetical protein AGLY_007047 [Aphis glycines]